MFPSIDPAGPGQKLAENVMHFARLLRGAGLRLGPDRVVDCVRALELADCNRRDDWYWTMSAVFLSKEEQRPIFDQAFRIFWRDPKLVEKMMNALLPKTYGRTGKPEQEQSQRLSDALFDQKKIGAGARGAEDRARRAPDLLREAKCCSAWTSTPCRRPSWPRRRRCCAACACRCR